MEINGKLRPFSRLLKIFSKTRIFKPHFNLSQNSYLVEINGKLRQKVAQTVN